MSKGVFWLCSFVSFKKKKLIKKKKIWSQQKRLFTSLIHKNVGIVHLINLQRRYDERGMTTMPLQWSPIMCGCFHQDLV